MKRHTYYVVTATLALGTLAGVTGSPALSPIAAAWAAPAAEAEGIIKQIDAQKGTVKIAHGPVSSLGWPAMTMDFQVENKAMLAPLKPSAQVKFHFEQREGRYVITKIETR